MFRAMTAERSKADTIAALASGHGRSAIAVIRLSGPATASVLQAVCGRLPAPRRATLVKMKDPKTGALIDHGLALWFPAPSSFTGEDMAELHVHGGRAVIDAMVNGVLTENRVRLAEPGEFAARAFENGKLDLSAVEGLADLINAETAAQARQALAQAEGGIRARAEDWRAKLLRIQALTEASIDFSDEADVADNALAEAGAEAKSLLADLRTVLASHAGERLREGFRIVIAGPPNVGKSCLLNALAKRDVAIVSDEPGTTRDVLEVHLDLDGLPVSLTDTAGLRDTAGAIEAEGMRRALTRAADADLVLWMIDADAPQWRPPPELSKAPVLPVLNKIDLASERAENPIGQSGMEGQDPIAISAKTGAGLTQLLEALGTRAYEALDMGGEPAAITRARHRHELEQVVEALARFVDERDAAPEIRAEELRRAARHLGRLTGHVDVEEVLGAIFGEFCIGK